MNIKQIAKNITSYDCGIVAAICFFSTLVALFVNLGLTTFTARLGLLTVLIFIYGSVIYFYRIKFLSQLLEVEFSFLKTMKLWRFVIGYLFTLYLINNLEYLLCVYLKLNWQIFAGLAITTILVFFVLYFTFASAIEKKFLKDGYGENFFKNIIEVPYAQLARDTICSVLQFVCICVLMALIFKIFSFYSLPIVIFSVYFTCLLIFYLERKKLYKDADVA